MAINRKKIIELSDEIMNGFRDWFGPSGECWCDKLKKFVEPNENIKDCPECSTTRNDELSRVYRYLHLHEDYKSY